MLTRRLSVLLVMATVFSVGHHVDHIIRGNHVGWPLIDRVTPFTYSLGVYPLILLGLVLTRWRRVGAGFWALLAGAGLLFVGLVHFGPLALEPPEDIVGPYRSRVAGWLALGWLVALLAILGVTAVYSALLWRRAARERRLPGQ